MFLSAIRAIPQEETLWRVTLQNKHLWEVGGDWGPIMKRWTLAPPAGWWTLKMFIVRNNEDLKKKMSVLQLFYFIRVN